MLSLTITSGQKNFDERPHCRLVTPRGCEWIVWCWPPSNTWFLGPTGPPSNWHLNRFSRFCRTHERDQQTDG